MKDEFIPVAEERATHLMEAGLDAVSAARAIEIFSGKANEDYGRPVVHRGRKIPVGQSIVERVYGGQLNHALGGQGLVFVADPPVEAPLAEALPIGEALGLPEVTGEQEVADAESATD